MSGHANHDHVLVAVEPGSEAKEELAVTVLAGGNYRLVVSRALTLGLAAGDVFAVDSATLRPRLLWRSGNLTIWLYRS